jgi:hypothetical protein
MLKMDPYTLLMGGYHIRNISLQRQRVEILQNSIPDSQHRSAWTTEKNYQAILQFTKEVYEDENQTSEEQAAEALAGDKWLKQLAILQEANIPEAEMWKLLGVSSEKEAPWTEKDWLDQGLKVPGGPPKEDSPGRVLFEISQEDEELFRVPQPSGDQNAQAVQEPIAADDAPNTKDLSDGHGRRPLVEQNEPRDEGELYPPSEESGLGDIGYYEV